MYELDFTRRFKKSLKKFIKSGRKQEIEALKEVIIILALGRILPQKHKNHYLSGKLSHYQECHIKDDLLLIYSKDEINRLLIIIDVGSHEDLFS